MATDISVNDHEARIPRDGEVVQREVVRRFASGPNDPGSYLFDPLTIRFGRHEKVSITAPDDKVRCTLLAEARPDSGAADELDERFEADDYIDEAGWLRSPLDVGLMIGTGAPGGWFYMNDGSASDQGWRLLPLGFIDHAESLIEIHHVLSSGVPMSTSWGGRMPYC